MSKERARRRSRRPALIAASVVVAATSLSVTPGVHARRAAARAPTGADYAARAFDVLAPGETGSLPADAHSTDQAALYDALTPLQGNVTEADLERYFKSERLGIQGPVARRESTGRPGLQVLRDSFDVPHVYGRTRDDVMFGAGFVTAEDRGLLLQEGRGPARLAVLDAPGVDAFSLVVSLRQFIPSAQAEAYVHSQVGVLTGFGARGRRVLRDLQDWVAGLNAWYDRNVPAATRPAPYTINDAIASFAFIGSIFGRGGGHEVTDSDLLASLEAQLGAAPGLGVFRDLRESDDPEAPVSVPGRFPFANEPAGPTPGAVVIDPGSMSASGRAAARAASAQGRIASNALLVGARLSASGHPLAVMGPQLGYFYPEIVMEMDLHGGGIDARGAAPPVSPYVLIGRGADFAWSLTSATNDDTDQFLEQLCNADGSPATRSSTSYVYKGRCIPMTQFDAGVLKGTGGMPDQAVTYPVTVHGPVSGTVTVGGRPYAIATMRANRGREPASELALADLNSGRVRSPATFLKAANEFETTFNWFYADSHNIAYFSSGRLPVRAPGTDPSLPTLGTGAYDWRGFLTQNQHPHALNPPAGLILNWNNKPAHGWGAADNNWSQGSVHRVQLFTGLGRGHDTLADVVSTMNRAATQDLRAVRVWPVISRVLAHGVAPTPLAQQAAALITAWAAHGASRIDANGDGKVDDPGAAVMDAAWKGIADAVLSPVLGPVLPKFAAIQTEDEAPSVPSGSGTHGNGGSSFGGGWYEYVDKDLRSVLGEPVQGAFSRRYCGAGVLAACATSLWSAIAAATTSLAAAQGPDPTAWRASATAERITFKPGLIPLTMRWTNRPTFQQAISFRGHRPAAAGGRRG